MTNLPGSQYANKTQETLRQELPRFFQPNELPLLSTTPTLPLKAHHFADASKLEAKAHKLLHTNTKFGRSDGTPC